MSAEALPESRRPIRGTAQDPVAALRVYRQKSDFAKARAAFNKAHEIDPDSLEVRYEGSEPAGGRGKNDDAIATLRTMLTKTVKKVYSESEKGSRYYCSKNWKGYTAKVKVHEAVTRSDRFRRSTRRRRRGRRFR